MSTDGSAALRCFAALRDRFAEGRGAISESDRRAWLKTVGIGAAAMPLLMVVLVLIAQRLFNAGALDWEPGFLLWLGSEGPVSFSTAVFWQTFGTDVTLVILIVSTASLAAWLRRPITAVSIVIAPIVTDLVGRFGWLLWDRARPDILHGGIASPALHSFPSGHTSKSFAVYGLLTFIWLRASGSLAERIIAIAIIAFITAVVALGRLTMGVHWPSDVIGGLVIGAAWLAVLAYGLRFERASAAARYPSSRKNAVLPKSNVERPSSDGRM